MLGRLLSIVPFAVAMKGATGVVEVGQEVFYFFFAGGGQLRANAPLCSKSRERTESLSQCMGSPFSVEGYLMGKQQDEDASIKRSGARHGA